VQNDNVFFIFYFSTWINYYFFHNSEILILFVNLTYKWLIERERIFSLCNSIKFNSNEIDAINCHTYIALKYKIRATRRRTRWLYAPKFMVHLTESSTFDCACSDVLCIIYAWRNAACIFPLENGMLGWLFARCQSPRAMSAWCRCGTCTAIALALT